MVTFLNARRGGMLLVVSLAAWVPAHAMTTGDRARPGLTIEPIRTQWPIAREASGQWVVLGEATARHAGSRPVTIAAVGLTVFDGKGAVLARQAFAGPGLTAVLGVLGFDAEGLPFPRPEGTTRLEPGDVGIAALGVLAGRHSLPRRAEITFRFESGQARATSVPLFAFDSGRRFSWPLPFRSERAWLVHNAFSPAEPVPTHRTALLPTPGEYFVSQRFAFDTVQVDAQGRTSDPPDSPRKEDYHAWGDEIRSAAAGKVVAVVADRPDQEIGSWDLEQPAGNYVVVQHAAQVYGLYAHMMLGSATVAVGDRVEAGQPIGRVGNSGHSTEPHLHFHFADRWDGLDPVLSVYAGQGVPALLSDASVARGRRTYRLSGESVLGLDLVTP
jgi:hypothetical protein